MTVARTTRGGTRERWAQGLHVVAFRQEGKGQAAIVPAEKVREVQDL
jgi:hypothetical protein